jgi:hypothetical protein
VHVGFGTVGRPLHLTRIDQHHLEAVALQQVVEWDPVGSAAGEVPKIGPFPSAFPQTGQDCFQSSGFPVTVEDFQNRFGILHYASLPVGKSSDLSPFAV